MRILNWNVWGAIGIGAARAERIISLLRDINADVLLLQEVPLRGDFLERLRTEGYQVTDPRSARPGLWKKGNAAVVASRLTMQEIDRPDGLRFEQLFTAVRIGGIEIASCHIPNASGHNSIARELGLPRDIKVAHLESAVSWLRAKSNRLIAGDFNEPDYIDSKSGNSISFPSSDSAHQDRQDSSSTSSRPRRSRSSTRPTDDEAHEQVSSAQGCLTIIVAVVIVAILAAIGSS